MTAMVAKIIGSMMVLMLLASLGCQKDKANPAAPINDNGKTPKDSLVVKAAEEMVAIPGGTFQMGSTEVTQELYMAVMDTNPADFATDGTKPVETVSWYDAALFCNELSRLSGKDTVYTYAGTIDSSVVIDYTKNGYRMPTEAEWEYACRAGTTTDYYWGKSYPITTHADTLAIDSNTVWSSNSNGHTWPVAGKKPNAWGLYDMSGNVWEWVNDWYGSYTAGPQADPAGPTTGIFRVLRGGGWDINDDYLRSTYRDYDGGPNYRDFSIGFRLTSRP